MKHQIKHRFNDSVLFECEVPNDVSSGMATRHALEQATKARANLTRANLDGANLAGAYLDGAKLIGERPVFQIGPIGPRCSFFNAWITDKGLFVTAECFKQKTIEEFRIKLAQSHGENDHAKEYEMALLMIECHAALWTPEEAA